MSASDRRSPSSTVLLSGEPHNHWPRVPERQRSPALGRSTITQGPFSGDAHDNYTSELFLPDPFVSNQPPRTRQAMPASSNVIDLTNSPPNTRPHEVIDLDALPDVRLPTVDNSVASLGWQNRNQNSDRPSHPANANSSNDSVTESAAWRQRRRDWLLETAQRRTQQRENRLDMTRETQTRGQAGAIPNLVGLMPEMIGSGVARFRAFIHGPHGGGPVRNAMGLPENFLPGSNISLVPHMNRFHAPNLNYAIYNDMFPGLHAPQPPPPKYEAPAPLKEPFTRTFTEKDMLICPGCRTELGGTGDEVRRKVWVSKCSHVYCGQCGSDIKKSAKKRGALCVAPGCAKKITKTRIFEAYI